MIINEITTVSSIKGPIKVFPLKLQFRNRQSTAKMVTNFEFFNLNVRQLQFDDRLISMHVDDHKLFERAKVFYKRVF